jgi:hypothetical protein
MPNDQAPMTTRPFSTPRLRPEASSSKTLGPLGAGQPLKPFIAAQRHAEEELQGAAGLVVQTPAHASLFDHPQQMRSNLLPAELIRRASEPFGDLGHGPHVGLDGMRREVAKLQILDQTLTKCGHDSLLGKRSDP